MDYAYVCAICGYAGCIRLISEGELLDGSVVICQKCVRLLNVGASTSDGGKIADARWAAEKRAEIELLRGPEVQRSIATNTFMLRVLTLFASTDSHDLLFWHTAGKYAPVTFFVNVNDVFHWACADLEEITRENITLAERAIEDVQSATRKVGWSTPSDWTVLFAARARKMRPQGAAYRCIERAVWPLLNACGPERVIGPEDPGNTQRPAQ